MVTLDDYIIRARLAPALYAVAPSMTLILLAVPWDTFKFPQAIASGSLALLLIGASDLARRLGKRVEQGTFRETGGQPFATALRYRDYLLHSITKARYHTWLATKIQESAPTRENEYSDAQSVDHFYGRCTDYLRGKTRDRERFKLVYEENVTYGFRRNLLGLKWIALSLDFLVLLACLYIVTQGLPSTFAITREMALLIGVFNAAHAVYFLFAVSKASVLAASDQYSRQLVLACEVLAEDDQ